MNPLTLTEFNNLLSKTVGDLKPFELELLRDALRRRAGWEKGNPGVDGGSSQQTLSTIATYWGN